MNFIEKMSNVELLIEFERMVNRIRSYNSNEQEEYKNKLKDEIQKRMNLGHNEFVYVCDDCKAVYEIESNCDRCGGETRNVHKGDIDYEQD